MALLNIPVLKRWSRAGGPYGYLRTWNWPITARKISQPYNRRTYFLKTGYSKNIHQILFTWLKPFLYLANVRWLVRDMLFRDQFLCFEFTNSTFFIFLVAVRLLLARNYGRCRLQQSMPFRTPAVSMKKKSRDRENTANANTAPNHNRNQN